MPEILKISKAQTTRPPHLTPSEAARVQRRLGRLNLFRNGGLPRPNIPAMLRDDERSVPKWNDELLAWVTCDLKGNAWRMWDEELGLWVVPYQKCKFEPTRQIQGAALEPMLMVLQFREGVWRRRKLQSRSPRSRAKTRVTASRERIRSWRSPSLGA